MSYFLTTASALNVPANQKRTFLHEIRQLILYPQVIPSHYKPELEIFRNSFRKISNSSLTEKLEINVGDFETKRMAHMGAMAGVEISSLGSGYDWVLRAFR